MTSKLNVKLSVKEELQEKRNEFLNLWSSFQKSHHCNVDKLIICGRQLVETYLYLYLHKSDANALVRILELNEVIVELYKFVTPENDYFIKDKCKYYANQILVLFFLNEMASVRRELIAYKNHYEKFKKFLKIQFSDIYKKMNHLYRAIIYISVTDETNQLIDINNRFGCQTYEMNITNFEGFKLQRAVIIGSCATQICYRGYTVDMLRIFQAIEYKQNDSKNLTYKLTNPRKWTFYNESIFDVLIGVNNATFNMSKHGIFLLYISGDEFRVNSKNQNLLNDLCKVGLKMKQLADENIEHPNDECLLPVDVISFLTVPTVLIIDSESSHHFLVIVNHISMPVLCLFSPVVYPDFVEKSNNGKLFTLFLSSPLKGFCWICQQFRIDIQIWQQLEHLLNEFMITALEELKLHMEKDQKLRLFMGDTPCHILFLRYLFCHVALRLHQDFPVDGYLPKCNFAELESEVVSNKNLHDYVYKMAQILDSVNKFAFTRDLSLTSDSIDVVY